ncbi:PTS system trehalose-specific EIIBC component [Clostridium uliginosum]|uniref:PTS system, trehalose-specific IIC component n=1 Tax=Clostridium uliginosum TaxID=119641 RepID=A0A1I1K7L0_9CLOT|nr:PTS system trehalose-specific EIIBC component [Clostridium uliginosum]SFC56521.1 PTS system, trehalose-specific IIC component [Clostridium uliginosum]
MGKFTNDVKSLINYLGGKENIATLTHCVTRLRFVLNDTKKADVNSIEKLASVKGTFTQAGQFQVIIGNEVSTFYNEFISETGIQGENKDAVKQAAKKNMSVLQRGVANLAEIFAPLIPAIIVGGLLLGFRNIIGDMKLFQDGTKTLTEISQFWNGTNSFLWLICEAIFHFLPVGVVWSVTKKMGANQMLGIVLGITLVSPQLLNAYAVSGAKTIPVWDFGFAKINMIGYQAQVIPAILVGFAYVYLERFWKKVSPDSIQMIIVPFCSLVPAVLLAHTVLGPIGWAIGNGIATVVQAGFHSSFGWLFGGVYGFVYPILVITGLHHTLLPIDLQLIATTGGTYMWPIVALANIAQGSAVLGYIYLNKKNVEEKQVAVPACISAYLGVTEPAIFGVNLKRFYPFVAAIIGSGIAGIVSMITGATANSVGVGGLPAILSMQGKSMLPYLICMAIAIVVPFILTIILSKSKLAKVGTK